MGGSSGKGGGSSQTIIGYNYFASFAGMAALGEVDELVEVVVEGESVWKPTNPILRTAVANPFKFTVSKFGEVHFYWGTADQTLTDPVLTKTGRDHPPYRNRAFAVFEDFFCGFERLSAPSIQIVVRRAGKQSIITGTPAALDDGQTNPIAIIAEILTSELTGAGLPATRINQASFQTVADALHTNRTTEYLSALITARTSALDIIAEINGYADTWFRYDDNGAIEAGRFQQGGGEIGGLPVVTPDDLEVIHDITSHDYTDPDVDDRLKLRFTNRERAFEDDAHRYDSPLNREFKETSDPATFDRSWITRPDQSAAKTAEIGDRQSNPYDDAPFIFREDKLEALGIKEGEQFVYSYTALNYREVYRAISINGYSDAGGPVEVLAQTERSIAPEAAQFASDSQTLEGDVDPVDSVYFDIIQVPSELADDSIYRVVPLIARTQGAVRGYDIYFRQNASVAFTFLVAGQTFGVPVRLTDAFANTGPDDDETGNLKIYQYSTDAPIGFDDLPGTQSDEEIADDNLLLIVIDAADPQTYEIMTVKSIESPTGDDYPIYVKRARRGTAKLSHLADAPVWFVFRSQLQAVTSGGWPDVATEATAADRTLHFKALPWTATQILDIDDATEHSLELFEQVEETIFDGNG